MSSQYLLVSYIFLSKSKLFSHKYNFFLRFLFNLYSEVELSHVNSNVVTAQNALCICCVQCRRFFLFACINTAQQYLLLNNMLSHHIYCILNVKLMKTLMFETYNITDKIKNKFSLTLKRVSIVFKNICFLILHTAKIDPFPENYSGILHFYCLLICCFFYQIGHDKY